jgi:hypothetical protein
MNFMTSAALVSALALATCLAAGISSAGSAQDLKATQRLNETQIGFDLSGSYGNYTLTVTGPNGFQASAASKVGTPAIDLRRFGAFDDGTYHYHLTASSDDKVRVKTPLDNGREGGPTDSMLKAVSLSGQFQVKGGTIVKASSAPPARLDKDAK